MSNFILTNGAFYAPNNEGCNKTAATLCRDITAVHSRGRDAVRRVFTTNAIRKVLSPFVWLLVAFVFVAQTATAQSENFPDGDGEGTVEKPYRITSAAELAKLAELVNAGNADYNSAHYLLTDDINLGVAPYNAGWTRIGISAANSFQGSFDGDNNVITGLYINASTNEQGLFGWVSEGEIKNLHIRGASVRGNAQSGILAGRLQSSKAFNCSSSGTMNGNGADVGGLIGLVNAAGSSVDKCYSTANATNTASGDSPTGGLIGSLQGTATDMITLTNSYATGTVAGVQLSGGLLGYGTFAEVASCYATGTVSASVSIAGGLVGASFNWSYLIIRNSFATGSVSGGTAIGGLIGEVRGENRDGQQSLIENCYATGAVSGTNNVGGIAGGAHNSVYLPDVNTVLKNCIALNPSVRSTGANVGRVIGIETGYEEKLMIIPSNNAAYDGIVNNANTTDWGATAHDNKQGESKTSAQVKASGFFEALFASTDAGVWTFAENRLPGLNGNTVNMPNYMLTQSFALSVNNIYNFPSVTPGAYTPPSLNVTVTNESGSSTGQLNIVIEGENAGSFNASPTTIAGIAQGGDETFVVSPNASLPVGIYSATVTVTDVASEYYESFEVIIRVTDGNMGIPDVGWYIDGVDNLTISNADQLAGLAQLVNAGNQFVGKTVTLTQDIDLSKVAQWSSGTGWTRIGTSETLSFRGTFDGDDNTISGLYINASTNEQGLFGWVREGEIKNLHIRDASVSANSNSGILAGRVQSSTVFNCSSSGTMNGNGGEVGGLIGLVELVGSSVDKCYSNADVNNSRASSDTHTGGLIGRMHGSNTSSMITLTNSYATGTVTSVQISGGLLGTANEGVDISSCYATGAVKATTSIAGGLVGASYNSSIVSISNSFTTGSVSGGTYIGGLIGEVRGISPSKIENCYTSGAVNGTNYVGGIAGGPHNTAALTNVNTVLTNCIALNPSVIATGGTNVGRILGNNKGVGSSEIIPSDNAAYDGIVNNANTTNWGETAHDNNQGEDKSIEDLQEITGFPVVFNASPWTYEPGKLPGLNGQAMDMPNHLRIKSFELDIEDVHIFPLEAPGYTAVAPLTVTVLNPDVSAIGPITIELLGEDDKFELSRTSITSIAASSAESFNVTPVTGLPLGQYSATVQVTDDKGVYLSFNVIFIVGYEGASGVPDDSWFDPDEDLFLISTPDELAGVAQIVNLGTHSFAGKTVQLANNIDLSIVAQWSNGTGWTRIGTSETNSFSGTFDGDDYIISGLYINNPSANDQGLFGWVHSGEIKNLHIKDASVTANSNSGILAGQVVSSTVFNCSSSGTMNGNVEGIGGLMGLVSGAGTSVDKCYSHANVNNNRASGDTHTGGLIGRMTAGAATSSNDTPITLTNSYATGTVTSAQMSGGLLGTAQYGVNISSCYATGAVSATTSVAGGLVGASYNNSVVNISNSFATGSVSGGSAIGGLIGEARGIAPSSIENCYATGAVSGTTNVGGILGAPLNNAVLPTQNTTVTNSIALNPSVKASSAPAGRVIGNDAGPSPAMIVPSNNAAFDGILNNANTTDWGATAHDNNQGESKSVAEIRANGYFVTLFTNAPGIWTFEPNTLPGLNDGTVDIPLHLAFRAQVPSITNPQSAQVTVGNEHTLSVTATTADGGTLTYQWYKGNDGESNADGEEISGATGATYKPDTSTDGEFYFYVVVTNTIDAVLDVDVKTATATSAVATLDVTNLPTYEVTVIAGAGAGTIGSNNCIAGSNVSITAGTDPAGKVFKNWTSTPAVAFADAFSANTTFVMPAEDVTVTAIYEAAQYVATLNVHKDGVEWAEHGKTFFLKSGTDETEIVMTGNGATLTATVLNSTWSVYEGETNTGVTIEIDNADGSKIVNYYTVGYRVVNAGTAMGSTVSATCNGSVIATGTVVLSGSTVTITAAGAEPDKNTYTYAWSGTAIGTGASYTTDVVAAVDAVCTVTGSRITSAESLLVNPLKAWVNNGILHVSGLTQGKVWNLYNASGALVKQGVADSDVVTINLNLTGVYIIQSEGNTLKVVVN